MLKLLLGFVIFSGTIVSIYSLSVVNADGNAINFNDYRGKKIFIVNTASGSAQAYQLAALQQLYQQHHDSMVVIAFPSNSFGNEPKTNEEIKTYMQGTYGISFPIAAKSWVSGDSANIVYRWLADKIQNDVLNGRTRMDFQKFLIDKTGMIIGRFDSSISPLSPIVQDAIHNN